MENQLVTFADDTCPRFTVACCLLDYSTVCLTDKFGNISIVSLLLKKSFFFVVLHKFIYLSYVFLLMLMMMLKLIQQEVKVYGIEVY
jgi:hypothetical protein